MHKVVVKKENKKRIMSCYLLLFVFAFFSACAKAENNKSQLYSAEDACLKQLKNVQNVVLNNSDKSELRDLCKDIPLNEDVGVQILSFIVGEPMVNILNAVAYVTGASHTLTKDSSIFILSKTMRDVFYAFNKFVFYFFVIIAGLTFFLQAIRLASHSDKAGLNTWLSTRGINLGTISLFMYPTIGWMSFVQFLGIFFITLVIFILKYLVTALFISSFYSDAINEAINQSKKNFTDDSLKIYQIYSCDLKNRENLVRAMSGQLKVMGSDYKSSMLNNELYRCLTTKGEEPQLIKTITKNNGFAFVDVAFPTIAKTEYCVDKTKNAMRNFALPTIETCGDAQIKVPLNVNNNYDDDVLNRVIDGLFNEQYLGYIKDLVLNKRELNCRISLKQNKLVSNIGDGCLIMSKINHGYDFKWFQKEGVDSLDHYNKVLSRLSKNNLKREQASIKNKMAETLKTKQLDLLSYFSTMYQNKNEFSLSIDDAAYYKLVKRIERGAWALGSVYFGEVTKSLETESIVHVLKNTYTIRNKSGFIDKIALAKEELGNAESTQLRSFMVGSILPRADFYVDQINCWYQQLDCQRVNLNPFKQIIHNGVSTLNGAIKYYLFSRIVSRVTKLFIGNKNELMVFEVFSDIYLVYIFIGLFLFIVIPAMPLFAILMMMITWSYDVIKELLGLQLSFLFSGLTFSDRIFSDDVIYALNRLMGLSLYMLAIIFGILASFLTFSFFFALNVFIIGLLGHVTGWNTISYSIESMVMTVIYDVITVIILFIEIKASVKVMSNVTREFATYFQLDLDDKISSIDMVIQRLTREIFPDLVGMLKKS